MLFGEVRPKAILNVPLPVSGELKPIKLKKYKKDGNKMINTIDALKVRIHTLQMRDPVGNMRIINKLKRRVRAMESK